MIQNCRSKASPRCFPSLSRSSDSRRSEAVFSPANNLAQALVVDLHRRRHLADPLGQSPKIGAEIRRVALSLRTASARLGDHRELNLTLGRVLQLAQSQQPRALRLQRLDRVALRAGRSRGSPLGPAPPNQDPPGSPPLR